MTREEFIQQALSFPPADRAWIADHLEQSLANDGFATPETAASWSAEIERRIAAFERGDLTAVEDKAALANARRRLAEHRAGRNAV